MMLKTSNGKVAARKWEENPSEGVSCDHVDQETNEPKEFLNDIKGALQMFMVSGFPPEHSSFIPIMDIHIPSDISKHLPNYHNHLI